MNDWKEIAKMALSEQWKNNREGLARYIFDFKRDDALFLIMVGMERCVHKLSNSRRKVLKVAPVTVVASSKKKYEVPVSKSFARRAMSYSIGIFTEWVIHNVPLGNATKGLLLAEAKTERSSSNGHLWNAEWYEELAAKMNDTQEVNQCWQANEVEELRKKIWQRIGGYEPPKAPKTTKSSTTKSSRNNGKEMKLSL